MWRIAFIIFASALAATVSVRPQLSVAVTDNGVVSQMNASNVRLRATLAGPQTRIKAWVPLAFTPDGRTLAVGYHDGSIGLWDVATGQLKKTLSAHKKYVLGLLFAPDGRMLASSSGDHTVRIWDQQSGQLVATLSHDYNVYLMSFSPDSKLLATASRDDKTATIWDGVTGFFIARLPNLTVHNYETMEGLEFSPDGRTLATATFQRASLWDVKTRSLKTPLVDSRYTEEVKVNNHGRMSNRVDTFSHASTIYRMAFSPDSRKLATGSRDTTAKLWDVETGRLDATLKHDGRVLALAFSRDSRTLMTGSDDTTAKRWDVNTGELRAELSHKGTVWSIDFSPDGELVATAADNDHSVKVWDVATGKLLNELQDARYPIAFSPDGKTLATGSQKAVVLLWDVQR